MVDAKAHLPKTLKLCWQSHHGGCCRPTYLNIYNFFTHTHTDTNLTQGRSFTSPSTFHTRTTPAQAPHTSTETAWLTAAAATGSRKVCPAAVAWKVALFCSGRNRWPCLAYFHQKHHSTTNDQLWPSAWLSFCLTFCRLQFLDVSEWNQCRGHTESIA